MGVAASPEQSESILSRHHPIGASTGYMSELREDWPAQVAEACDVSSFAVELSALSERQLGPLTDYLSAGPELPFLYVSIHGPSKDRRMEEGELVARLGELAQYADAIVMHPDTIEEPDLYRALGRTLVIENMDGRKSSGRTAGELESLFAALPEAGFCFDIAHAWSIDSEMAVAATLLDHLGDRLRHVHLSSLTDELHHVPLTDEHEELFRPLLERCVDVPWILEAPPKAA